MVTRQTLNRIRMDRRCIDAPMNGKALLRARNKEEKGWMSQLLFAVKETSIIPTMCWETRKALLLQVNEGRKDPCPNQTLQ